MRTRSRDYGSPPPPPAKRPRRRAAPRVEPPPEPERLLPPLPIEVLEVVFFHAYEDGNKEITDIKQLPTNGQARQNRRLGELISMTLNRVINKYLQSLTWKRVDIDYQDNWDFEPEIAALERLTEKAHANRYYTHSFNVAIYNFTGQRLLPPRLLQLITQIFETSQIDKITEVSIGLDLHAGAMLTNEERHSMGTQIDNLMRVMPSFKNLTTFKYWANHTAWVSDSCLASVIQNLPKLRTIFLRGYPATLRLREYRAELSRALASRCHLTSLNIREMESFSPQWCSLEWRAPLRQLTVEPPNRWTNFDKAQLLTFCSIFRHTLVSLYFDCDNFDYPLLAEDVEREQNLAQELSSLKYLTFTCPLEPSPALWPFSRSPQLEELTWRVTWGNHRGIEEFRETHFPADGRWPSLRRVNLPTDIRTHNPMVLTICNEFGVFLNEQNPPIDFQYIPFDGLNSNNVARWVNNLKSDYHPRPIYLPPDL